LYTADDNASYYPESTYSGEIGLRKLTPELAEMGYGVDDVYDFDGCFPVVVLWPTN